VAAALTTIGAMAPQDARVAHIRNTLELGTLSVSSALLEEVGAHPHLSEIGAPAELAFDAEGRLAPLEMG
jgi:hypothetical protein